MWININRFRSNNHLLMTKIYFLLVHIHLFCVLRNVCILFLNKRYFQPSEISSIFAWRHRARIRSTCGRELTCPRAGPRLLPSGSSSLWSWASAASASSALHPPCAQARRGRRRSWRTAPSESFCRSSSSPCRCSSGSRPPPAVCCCSLAPTRPTRRNLIRVRARRLSLVDSARRSGVATRPHEATPSRRNRPL